MVKVLQMVTLKKSMHRGCILNFTASTFLVCFCFARWSSTIRIGPRPKSSSASHWRFAEGRKSPWWATLEVASPRWFSSSWGDGPGAVRCGGRRFNAVWCRTCSLQRNLSQLPNLPAWHLGHWEGDLDPDRSSPFRPILDSPPPEVLRSAGGAHPGWRKGPKAAERALVAPATGFGEPAADPLRYDPGGVEMSWESEKTISQKWFVV